jgi:hypothetical protein
MPNRGSQSVHDNDYQWLVEVYGETCLLCGKPPRPGLRLEVDHIDNSGENYDKPSNKSLVCGECNCWLRGIDARDPENKEDMHRKVIENHRALRMKARAREREKSGKNGQQGGSPPIVESKIIREYKKIRKRTGIDVPLPNDTFKKDVLDYFNGSSEMKANARYYPAFALITWETLIERGPTTEEDILDIGALLTHANQTTLKRYLKGWYAPHKSAPLSRTDIGGEWKIYFKDPAKAMKAGRQ